jgi:hypothetical protein
MDMGMMAAAQTTYRRLPGRRRRVGALWTAARHSLWLGADHLLQVESRFYSEEYRRFYYHDIELLMVRRTRHWLVWSVLFGVLLSGSVWWGVQAGEPVGQSLGAALAGLSLLALLVNVLYGPTCACHLRTAVQTVLLPSLNRLRYVRKVLPLLQPFIMQAQGELAPHALAAGLATAITRAESQTAPRRRPSPQAAVLRPFRGGRHGLMFGLLLLDGAMTLLTFLDNSAFVLLGTWGIMLSVFVATLLALIFQQQSDCPKGVRWLTWGVGVYVCLLYMVRTVPATLFTLKTSDLALVHSLWEVIKLMAAQSPRQNPYVYTVSLMSLLGSVGLGALGWFSLLVGRRQRHALPPSRPASTAALEE